MLAILITSRVLGAGEPGPVTLEGLSSQPAALATMPRAELKIESDGKTTTYAGVPLAAILATRTQPIEGMPGLRDLSDAILLVRGTDGYQAAVSAAAVAMDPKGERYLLALSRDGENRPPQLIVPGDPNRARWIRDIAAIRLARLNQVVKPEP